MDIVICTGRGSRCVKEKCVGGTKGREVKIQDSGRVSSRDTEEVEWRRGGVSEGSGVKKAGAGEKDNGGICLRVQKSSKREWI